MSWCSQGQQLTQTKNEFSFSSPAVIDFHLLCCRGLLFCTPALSQEYNEKRINLWKESYHQPITLGHFHGPCSVSSNCQKCLAIMNCQQTLSCSSWWAQNHSVLHRWSRIWLLEQGNSSGQNESSINLRIQNRLSKQWWTGMHGKHYFWEDGWVLLYSLCISFFCVQSWSCSVIFWV